MSVVCYEPLLNRKSRVQLEVVEFLKKWSFFILVGIAHMVDVEVLGAGDVIRNTVIFFYLSNEGISMLENAIRLGLPVPEKLRNILL